MWRKSRNSEGDRAAGIQREMFMATFLIFLCVPPIPPWSISEGLGE